MYNKFKQLDKDKTPHLEFNVENFVREHGYEGTKQIKPSNMKSDSAATLNLGVRGLDVKMHCAGCLNILSIYCLSLHFFMTDSFYGPSFFFFLQGVASHPYTFSCLQLSC